MEKDLGDNAKKFLFDINDFGEDAIRKKREAARRPTFSQEEIQAARQTGFDEGKQTGIKETLASQESQIRDVMQQVVLAATRLEQEENKRIAAFIEQSALITAQALSKTVPALMDILALEQISGFMKHVLGEQISGQTITIHVAPLHYDQIKTRLEDMLKNMRRKTTCTIAPDNTLSGLQCRVEWTGGGAEWDPGRVANTLLETIISHLPAHLRSAAILPAESVDEASGTTHNETSSLGDVP
jgi:flagellar assembly protein FliH